MMLFDIETLPDVELLCLNSILGLVEDDGEPVKEWIYKTVNGTIIEAIKFANSETEHYTINRDKYPVVVKWCEQNIELFKSIDAKNITMLDYANIRLLYGKFQHRVFKIANILKD
jgi:hypothetical protein